MYFDTKLCRGRLVAGSVLAGSIFCLLMTAAALAQTDQQKETAPGRAEVTPTQPAQAQQQQPGPPPIWVVNCADNRGKLDCRAAQQVFIKTTGQRLLSVAVRVPPETKKPILMLQVPLGVYLPAGASLQIGKDEAKTLPFKGCGQAGCVAEYAIKDAEIGAMLKGADLKISVQNQNQKPAFTITVPVTGFAEAYAKIQ